MRGSDNENAWRKAGLPRDTKSSACYIKYPQYVHIYTLAYHNLSRPSDKRIMQEVRKDVPNS